jgi:alpha-tubulin suppressor-like RCC1 family protein
MINIRLIFFGAFILILACTACGNKDSMGNNSYGQLGDGTDKSNNMPVKIMENVILVEAGDNSSYAVTADNTL